MHFFFEINPDRPGGRPAQGRHKGMSLLDPAIAYDHNVLPVSDRILSLVEAPLAAFTLLEGLTRQREGGALNILVRLRPRF